MLMADDYQRIELITGTARRRLWTTEQKLRIIEASFELGETVSSVARRYGVAPNLLYRWRRLMAEGGAAAVGSDGPVGRQFGGPPARGAGAGTRTAAWPQDHGGRDPQGGSRQGELKKSELATRIAAEGRFPVKTVADTLGVARSHLHDRLRRPALN